MTRYVHFASRLTGWNAIKSRVSQLGLEMTDAQIKQCTTKIKAMADVRHLAIEDTDAIINNFYENLYTEGGKEKPLLDDLTTGEEDKLATKEAELGSEPEKKVLDRVVDEQTEVLAATTLNGTGEGQGLGSEGVNGGKENGLSNGYEVVEALNGSAPPAAAPPVAAT